LALAFAPDVSLQMMVAWLECQSTAVERTAQLPSISWLALKMLKQALHHYCNSANISTVFFTTMVTQVCRILQEKEKTVQKRRCNSWNNKNTPESAESLDGYDCDVNSSKLFD